MVAFLVLLTLVGGAWGLRSYDPARGTPLPACRFNQMTGLQCPGCGATRASHHLLNGRIRQALYFNAFFVITVPGLFLWALWWLRHWRRGHPLSRRAFQMNAWLAGGYLAAWLMFWLVRNLPGWPML